MERGKVNVNYGGRGQTIQFPTSTRAETGLRLWRSDFPSFGKAISSCRGCAFIADHGRLSYRGGW